MTEQTPKGKIALSAIAMPANTNVNGDIFGGWLLSLMDKAGGAFCRKYATNRVVTIAIDGMTFLTPVHVGDTVLCYCEMIKVGRTSMTVNIEVWADRFDADERHIVTNGTFTYVAIDEKDRKPTPVPPMGK